MRGRKPLATAVKERSGSFVRNPQRKNRKEPKGKKGFPPKPDTVSADEVASKKWDATCVLLDELGILTTADEGIVEAYANTYSRYVEALQDIRNRGQLIAKETKHGESLSRNPASLEMHECMRAMLKQLAEMGLTPSSRTRVHGAGKEEEDPFTEWLKEGRN